MTSASYLTVQALTKYIKRKFDADPHLRDVYVKGELSNVKIHTSGHIYFTLKDQATKINATMFRSHADKLKFKPENGMMVFIRGDVNVYEQGGTYQLYTQTMEPDGVGSLFVAYNQLLETLQKEGLFNTQWKQPIPRFPKRIGVLTAVTGAAIRDICTTLSRRYPMAEILIYETIVQGAQSAPHIVRNIELANEQELCDVLIVGRGGGSIEDLWAFNEEVVARAIFSSRIPIISAVGHETDTTIADYVADLRAPTPTAAAELAVPHQQELYQRVLASKTQLHQLVTSQVNMERKHLEKLLASYPLATPERLYRPFTERLIQMDMQLDHTIKQFMMQKRSQFKELQSNIQQQSPAQAIDYSKKNVEQLTLALSRAAIHSLEQRKQAFSGVIRTLEALNPLSIMNRGFTVPYLDGKLVKSALQLKPDDEIKLAFHDGEARAKILAVDSKIEGEE